MKCPFCATLENRVIDSRLSAGGEVTRRRRECESCGRRYTTYERVEQVFPLVVKKDGRREPFDRMKVLAGLRRACEKRPVSSERLERLVDSIERDLVETGEKEVPSAVIGERVMALLRDVDQVAYVRFASVYREFKDIHEFMDALSTLLKTPAPGTPSPPTMRSATRAKRGSVPPGRAAVALASEATEDATRQAPVEEFAASDGAVGEPETGAMDGRTDAYAAGNDAARPSGPADTERT
jgi:transcriptional repressor NrdR